MRTTSPVASGYQGRTGPVLADVTNRAVLLQWESFQETLRADTLKASRIRWPHEFAVPVLPDTKPVPLHARYPTTAAVTFKTDRAAKVDFAVSPLTDPVITVVL